MAELNFMPVMKCPVLAIPDIGVEEHDNALRFRIVTTRGRVDVEGRLDTWYCVGSAESLAAARLVETTWLPGSPGNNKTRQTVVFGDDGPVLYRGNPRGRSLGACIRIARVSAGKFQVEIPATAEQIPILKDRWAKYFEELAREREQKALEKCREKLRREARNRTPDEVRAALQNNLDTFSLIVDGQTRGSGFQLDAASARIIDAHLSALRAAFRNASVTRAPGEFSGNVMSFRRT